MKLLFHYSLRAILFILCIVLTSASDAQLLNLEWVETPGNLVVDFGIDSENNMIILGKTDDSITMGAVGESLEPIPNTETNYIAKYNSDRQLQWIYSFEIGSSISPNAIGVDNNNDIFIIGWFSGTVDFDGGISTSYRSASGPGDPFVVKLSSDGQFMWDASFTGGSINVEYPHELNFDQNNNVFIVGYFEGEVDFDPGLGFFSLTQDGYTGDFKVYVVKLNSSGGFEWAKKLGGMQVFDVQIDGSGNVITAGNGTYSGDYDPGEGVFELTGSGFISKLDNEGNFVWAANIATCPNLGNDCWALAQNLAIDDSDNFYVVSTFRGAMDFDLGPGENYIYPSEPNGIWNYDVAILKYSASGEQLWIKHIPCSGEILSGFQTIVDTDGNLVATSLLEGSIELETEGLTLTSNSTINEYNAAIFKLNPNGQVIWSNVMGLDTSTSLSFLGQDSNGIYYTGGAFSSSTLLHTTNGDLVIESTETSYEGLVLKFTMSDCSTIAHVHNDLNQNCTNTQAGVSGIVMEINPGNYVATSNFFGDFYMCQLDLPDGVYTATIDPQEIGWQSLCGIEETIEILNGEVVSAAEFYIFNENACAEPHISLACPTMRRCSENTWPIYLSTCNSYSASGVFESAYAVVEFDEGILIESAEVPYVDLGNNTYQFELGNLNPGQCLNTIINANFSCDLEIDETLCMEATLYPVPECTEVEEAGPGECTEPWDQSSLHVEGECDEDTGTITFTIENDGEAMVCESEVRVYVDGDLFATYYIQLGAESDTTFTFPTNGGTWILQADQHPLHPGNSQPNDHVEGCGDIEGEGDGDDDDEDGDSDDDDEWEPGLVDDLPCGDESPFVDEFCGQVVGSFDPNDKRGYPDGVGEAHDILPNEQLQYMIRFQNTGTAPAYTVVIRDTLDTDLDIFSVTPGVSSHDYTFTMYGERVLQWTFNNIMLPDSFSNEEESHGFITYTVNQLTDLQDGTAINNSAAIYFDSNEPIITNTTLHTINRCLFRETQSVMDVTAVNEYLAPDGQLFNESGTYTSVLTNAAGCDSTITINLTISVGVLELDNPGIRVFPIPASQTITAMWNGDVTTFTITTPDGRLVRSGRIIAGANVIDISALASGTYVLKADDRVTRFVVK